MPIPDDRKDAPLPSLEAFRQALDSDDPSRAASLLETLAENQALELALHELKRSRSRLKPGDAWHALKDRMSAEVTRGWERRKHLWQLDPHRQTLRLLMEVRSPACLMHPSALQAALAKALVDAGLPLAMGLEKSPRPMVRLGHPLPLGVEGLAEWADVVLRESVPLGSLPERITACCPAGLRLMQAERLPNHASPVLDLCREAHWQWPCPVDRQESARERMAVFEAAETFEIEKAGKVEGHKQVKRVEVRHLVLGLSWEGEHLHFSTRIAPGEALNPVKLLAGVLAVDPSEIQGLTRLKVVLGPDLRLAAAEKYQPKLHNLFEDAVLLETGSNIRIIDEEDDDPIVIRRDEGRSPRRP